MNTCKNCNEPLNGNYCSNCGQPAELKRIDGRYIINEIGDFLFANKGMIYTIKKVLINPGESVRRFIKEDRYRFVKPITFLFITTLVYTLACYLFHIDLKDTYQQPEIELPTLNLIINWIIDYPGYSNIIVGLFIAFWIKLFFRKSDYNIFEIFILLCFITGISSLFTTVIVILQGLTHLSLIHIATFTDIIYCAWAIGQFFNKKKAAGYIKALLSYTLGFLIFGILVAIIAVLIDIMINPAGVNLLLVPLQNPQ